VVASTETSPVSLRLEGLAGALDLLVPAGDDGALTAERDRLAGIVRGYLLPRAAGHPPLTVVFAGPTGSGKSTLVNSLIGLDLSPVGVVRPTTSSPVVLAAGEHAPDYASIGGVACVVVTGSAPILSTMTLVDTPDIDSTAEAHRVQAESLVDHADVVVFVTSASRYADDVPWQLLRRALARGTQVVNVLNRVGSASAGARLDFKARLAAAGLDADLIVVPEHHLGERPQLPGTAIRSLRRRLLAVADEHERAAGERFHRVLASVVGQISDLSAQVEAERSSRDERAKSVRARLAERVGALDLEDLANDSVVGPPRRLWVGKASTAIARDVWERTLRDRIRARVQSDIRSWLAEEALFSDVLPDQVIGAAGQALENAIEGWVGQVREAAGPVVASRAHRDLGDRLGVVYALVGEHVLEKWDDGPGDAGAPGLDAALGALTSVIAPAHA